MRIAFFSDTFLPVNDGVGHLVNALAEALVRQGHQITVFTSRFPGSPRREMLPNGVEVLRASSLPLPHYPQYRTPVFPLTLLQGQQFGRRFDVVHVHTPFLLGTVGFIAARRWGLPLVGTFHTNLRDMRPSFPRNLLTALFFWVGGWYQSGVYWRCDVTTVPTEEARQVLQEITGKRYRHPIEVVPNGIETSRFHPGVRSPELSEKLGANGRPLVTFLSRLTLDKGIHRFLDALAGIPSEVPFLGVVGGTGVEEERARERVQREAGLRGRVMFLGAVPEEEKPALLAQSRVFVLPSTADTSSIVTLEAMASGAACAVTRQGGPRRLVREGENALLIDPEDPADIRNAIVSLLSRPALADRLARGGVAYVQSEASIDRTAREFLRLYAEAGEHRVRGRSATAPMRLGAGELSR